MHPRGSLRAVAMPPESSFHHPLAMGFFLVVGLLKQCMQIDLCDVDAAVGIVGDWTCATNTKRRTSNTRGQVAGTGTGTCTVTCHKFIHTHRRPCLSVLANNAASSSPAPSSKPASRPSGAIPESWRPGTVVAGPQSTSPQPQAHDRPSIGVEQMWRRRSWTHHPCPLPYPPSVALGL